MFFEHTKLTDINYNINDDHYQPEHLRDGSLEINAILTPD